MTDIEFIDQILGWIREHRILVRIFAFVVTLVLAFIINWIVKKLINKAIRLQAEKLNTSPTTFVFMRSFATFIVYMIAFFIILEIVGVENIGTKLFASAGIAAAAIAFASQNAIGNVMSGFIILFSKPIRVGDYIDIDGGKAGTVESVSIRYTVIRNAENRRIMIPNSTIADATLINSTIMDDKILKFIEVGIAYSADLLKAKDIFRKIVEKHPLCIDNRTAAEKKKGEHKVIVRVITLGDSSITLRAYAWAKNNSDTFILVYDTYENVKLAFDREGIEIPYPYQNVVLRK